MKDKNDFQELTEQRAKESLLREFFLMLMHNKKWWLTPIILIMLMFGLDNFRRRFCNIHLHTLLSENLG